MKISERSQKLGGVIEENISTIIHQFLTPESVGFLTVTAVEVSGDLGVCDIFLRSLNGPKDFCLQCQKRSKIIAHELAKKIPTRRVIRLRFKIDKSLQNSRALSEEKFEGEP